ncbi:sodium:proton antiporter NhaD [Neptunomonas phycophila]|uniref:sodium:proton antiporter NhaD n=1 Tax=Neptunomonas phycophila TaxID=1572645 RepID=UPI000948E32D|nr:sodium:proton antiporter NhaD [Neptunomonas phycophila]
MTILLLLIALAAFLFIALEEVTHINKAKTTLFFGTLAWLILFLSPPHGASPESLNEALGENLMEIASLWLFLMAAMTFVAFLNQKGLIESIIHRCLPKQVSERRVTFLVAAFAFVFSSLSDNITATLVSITLVMSLGLPKNRTMRLAVLSVFAVNSGGVSLITGDVTTLMIFLEGKASIDNLLWLSIPSFCSVLLLASLLSIGSNNIVVLQRKSVEYDKTGLGIAALFLCTILATILLNLIAGVPPVLTFLFGLSVMFLLGQILYRDEKRESLLDYVRLIEYDTLLFFLGILLLVGMLKDIGVLDQMVKIYDLLPTELANYFLGLLSALVDNVPLTAALLKAGIMMNPAQWLSLTYAVGVGGSLLVIGSAAGIVAMSKVNGLSFFRYMKYSFLLLLCYSVGYVGSLLMGQWLYS